ncbi:kinase-like protein [Lophium mytilinum]|uniref:non-specific serine/threonine protein kinase n=1 Tax=Lophium mytilinum TaxID=390894 RepID=A0A6A6Q9L2_9PEZI|nr:kinase-like protein [Lophium mytilinum]
MEDRPKLSRNWGMVDLSKISRNPAGQHSNSSDGQLAQSPIDAGLTHALNIPWNDLQEPTRHELAPSPPIPPHRTQMVDGQAFALDSKIVRTSIIFKDLRSIVSKDHLLQIMETEGLPRPYAFNYQEEHGLSSGHAVAEFLSAEEAAHVINTMNNWEILGRLLKVEYAKLLPARRRSKERETSQARSQPRVNYNKRSPSRALPNLRALGADSVSPQKQRSAKQDIESDSMLHKLLSGDLSLEAAYGTPNANITDGDEDIDYPLRRLPYAQPTEALKPSNGELVANDFIPSSQSQESANVSKKSFQTEREHVQRRPRQSQAQSEADSVRATKMPYTKHGWRILRRNISKESSGTRSSERDEVASDPTSTSHDQNALIPPQPPKEGSPSAQWTSSSTGRSSPHSLYPDYKSNSGTGLLQSRTRDDVAFRCGLTIGHSVLSPGSKTSFIVCSHLGHGSLGVVEEVRVAESGFETFVRKRVQLPYHQRKRRLQIIQEEAKVLEDLCHPHVVQILGSYEDLTQKKKEFYCLLMSPVGENDLSAFLDEVGERRPTLEEERWLRRWFSCLISALVYMHDQGIRHQDIKPSNIVHRGSQIFFTDFSSSSRFVVGQTTSTEEPARTSAMYAAPEVLNNFVDESLVKHGRGTDIFSLGCVFAEMFSVSHHHKSISEFHDFLLKHVQEDEEYHYSPGAAAARNILIYSRVTERIKLWFRTITVPGFDVFPRFIAPMIGVTREERPDARALLNTFSACPFIWTPCKCNQ